MSRRGETALETLSFIFRYQKGMIWVTGLLYAAAAISFIVGVLTAGEFRTGYVSVSFLLTVVILPYIMVIFSFLFQLAAAFADSKARELQVVAQSRFLAAVEGAISHSAISRTFLTHLLEDWEESMKKLPGGVITVQKDYWTLAAELFDFAKTSVECTSMVPLVYWDRDEPQVHNQELIKYKDEQVRKLLKRSGRPIPVSRTFLIPESELTDAVAFKRFFKIVREHLTDGFRVYYISEHEHGSVAFTDLARDFALIDDRLIMIGRLASHDKMVYHYDFFDLSLLSKNPELFLPARSMFSNEADVVVGGEPKLKISSSSGRRRIDQFPALSDPAWQSEKVSIEQLVKLSVSRDPEYK